MGYSGEVDKFPSLTIPSSDDTPEQDTGIVMLTTSDSSDEYQTPPEYRSCSQNSNNDDQILAIVDRKTENGDGVMDGDGDIIGDGDGDNHGVRIIEENDKLIVENEDNDTEPTEVEYELIKEVTGLLSKSAHEVFVKMPVREQEASVSGMVVNEDVNRMKRKLPFTIEEDEYSKHDLFKDLLTRLVKVFVGEEKREIGDASFDFLEIAKMRGMTFPRPQWWKKEGC